MLSFLVKMATLAVPADAPYRRATSTPGVFLIVALHLWVLMGALLGLWGMAGMGALGLVSVAAFLARGESLLPTARARRLAASALPGVLGVLVYAGFVAYGRASCAALAPGVFLLMWPITAFVAVAGGAVVARLGAQEGWPAPEMAKEGLAGLLTCALGASVVLAGSWTCLPSGGLLVLHTVALIVAALASAGLMAGRPSP